MIQEEKEIASSPSSSYSLSSQAELSTVILFICIEMYVNTLFCQDQ